MRLLFYVLALILGIVALTSAGSGYWDKEDAASLTVRKNSVESVSVEVVQVKQGHVAFLRLHNRSSNTLHCTFDGSNPLYRLRQLKLLVWRELNTDSVCGTEHRSHKLLPGEFFEFDVDLSNFGGTYFGSGLFQVGIRCILANEGKVVLTAAGQSWTAWSPPIESE